MLYYLAHLNIRHYGLCLLVLVCLTLLPIKAIAQSEPAASQTNHLIQYFKIGFLRQLPSIFSNKGFVSASDLGLNVGLEYEYQRSWLLSFDFKLSNLESQSLEVKEIALLSLQQSIKYICRVYYPLYLTLGYDLGLLYAAKKIRVPPEKHPDFKPKVILGLNFGLFWKQSQSFRFYMSGSSWRGMDGDGLQATELLLGTSYRL